MAITAYEVVDKVLAEATEEQLEEWYGSIENEGVWYCITDGGHLAELETALESSGVNIDSIKLWSYVQDRILYDLFG